MVTTNYAMMQLMEAVVERYMSALTSKDWARLSATLADSDFERVGPFEDRIASKAEYVDFLDRVVSPLQQYSVSARRSISSDGVVYAEIVESFTFGDTAMAYPEVLVFDLTGEGLIRRVQVYMMRPGEEPPVPGAKA